MDKVEEFFHFISPKIISLTNERFENTKEVKYKDEKNSLDIATEADLDNERLITNELKARFPNDQIIAEETFNEVDNINQGRSWIIDPICGSANFRNGIKFFSTNIALANNGLIMASCVVDHSIGQYIWSIGNSQININDKRISPKKRTKGIMVEVDLPALTGMDSNVIDKHIQLTSYLLHKKNYYLSSFCTSLLFAYVALGRIDAYANGFSKVWDVAAANFLILQAGGIVTELDGSPWTLNSNNVLGSFRKELHIELLGILNS